MQNTPQKSGENSFINLLNLIVDPAVIVNEKGCILLVNNAFEDITGLSKNKVIGEAFLELGILPPESKAILLENLKKRMQGLPVQPYEIPFTDKNRETRYVEVNAKKIDYDGHPVDLVIFRDITRRKRNENQLKEYSEKMEMLVDEKVREIKESAEKLRQSAVILKSINDSIIITDFEGNITYWNEGASRIFGYTDKEVLGKSIEMVRTLGEKAHITKSQCEDLKKRKGWSNREWTGVRKDGTNVTLMLATVPLENSNGEAIGLIGVGKDLTKRKQAEESLRKERQELDCIVDSSPIIIFYKDKEGKFIRVNKTFAEALKTPKEDFLGKTVFDLYPAEIAQGMANDDSEVLKSGRPKLGIIEQYASASGMRWVQTDKVPIFDENGIPVGIVGFAQDITEQKKMEAEVKQKLDMLEALTENLSVGFSIISKDYHVLWANKFIKNNVGNVEGKQCYASLNTLDHICPDCGVRKVFEEGVAQDSHEYTNIGIHGKPYYVELIATPLKDKDGNVTAALEFVVDIAEKKHMQSELTEYSQKLEKLVDERTEELEQTQTKLLKAEKLAAIGELAGMIGHDLRNPLTGIKGAAYYLKTKCAAEIGATGKEMLKTIDKAIDHSNKIINDLLEYSSKLRLDLTETTPKSLLKTTLTLIEIPERTQIIDATKNKPKIKADIGNIIKVFANIITNAIDAMPGTGTLTITSKTAKGNVNIIFKDTGIGMTEETLSKLKLGFPLFTTKAKGMGFGLPICKRIVEAHSGKISLKSTLGKGTTVIVTIPVNPKTVDENEEKWIFNEFMLQAMRTSQKTPRKP